MTDEDSSVVPAQLNDAGGNDEVTDNKVIFCRQIVTTFLIEAILSSHLYCYVIYFLWLESNFYYRFDQALWTIVFFIGTTSLFTPIIRKYYYNYVPTKCIKYHRNTIWLAVLCLSIIPIVLASLPMPWFVHAVFYGVFGGFYISIIRYVLRKNNSFFFTKHNRILYNYICQIGNATSLIFATYFTTFVVESSNVLYFLSISYIIIIPICLIMYDKQQCSRNIDISLSDLPSRSALSEREQRRSASTQPNVIASFNINSDSDQESPRISPRSSYVSTATHYTNLPSTSASTERVVGRSSSQQSSSSKSKSVSSIQADTSTKKSKHDYRAKIFFKKASLSRKNSKSSLEKSTDSKILSPTLKSDSLKKSSFLSKDKHSNASEMGHTSPKRVAPELTEPEVSFNPNPPSPDSELIIEMKYSPRPRRVSLDTNPTNIRFDSGIQSDANIKKASGTKLSDLKNFNLKFMKSSTSTSDTKKPDVKSDSPSKIMSSFFRRKVKSSSELRSKNLEMTERPYRPPVPIRPLVSYDLNPQPSERFPSDYSPRPNRAAPITNIPSDSITKESSTTKISYIKNYPSLKKKNTNLEKSEASVKHAEQMCRSNIAPPESNQNGDTTQKLSRVKAWSLTDFHARMLQLNEETKGEQTVPTQPVVGHERNAQVTEQFSSDCNSGSNLPSTSKQPTNVMPKSNNQFNSKESHNEKVTYFKKFSLKSSSIKNSMPNVEFDECPPGKYISRNPEISQDSFKISTESDQSTSSQQISPQYKETDSSERLEFASKLDSDRKSPVLQKNKGIGKNSKMYKDLFKKSVESEQATVSLKSLPSLEIYRRTEETESETAPERELTSSTTPSSLYQISSPLSALETSTPSAVVSTTGLLRDETSSGFESGLKSDENIDLNIDRERRMEQYIQDQNEQRESEMSAQEGDGILRKFNSSPSKIIPESNPETPKEFIKAQSDMHKSQSEFKKIKEHFVFPTNTEELEEDILTVEIQNEPTGNLPNLVENQNEENGNTVSNSPSISLRIEFTEHSNEEEKCCGSFRGFCKELVCIRNAIAQHYVREPITMAWNYLSHLNLSICFFIITEACVNLWPIFMLYIGGLKLCKDIFVYKFYKNMSDVSINETTLGNLIINTNVQLNLSQWNYEIKETYGILNINKNACYSVDSILWMICAGFSCLLLVIVLGYFIYFRFKNLNLPVFFCAGLLLNAAISALFIVPFSTLIEIFDINASNVPIVIGICVGIGQAWLGYYNKEVYLRFVNLVNWKQYENLIDVLSGILILLGYLIFTIIVNQFELSYLSIFWTAIFSYIIMSITWAIFLFINRNIGSYDF